MALNIISAGWLYVVTVAAVPEMMHGRQQRSEKKVARQQKLSMGGSHLLPACPLNSRGHDRCPDCQPLPPVEAIDGTAAPMDVAARMAEHQALVRTALSDSARQASGHAGAVAGSSNRPFAIALVCYAHGEPFMTTQKLLVRTAHAAGIDRVFKWDDDKLMATAWGARVLPPLKAKFGPTARWVWKPFIISDALRQMRDGDVVLYMDSSRHIQRGISAAVTGLCESLYRTSVFSRQGDVTLNPAATRAGAQPDASFPQVRGQISSLGFVPGVRLWSRNSAPNSFNGRNSHPDHHTKTRRCDLCDVLARTRICAPADNGCCQDYYHAPHVQAAYSAWQKNPVSAGFVSLWLALCEDFEVLKRSKWGDQTVLSILATKYSFDLNLTIPYFTHPLDGVIRPYTSNQSAEFASANELKNPTELFGRFVQNPKPGQARQAPGQLPSPVYFLRQRDSYPECSLTNLSSASAFQLPKSRDVMCTTDVAAAAAAATAATNLQWRTQVELRGGFFKRQKARAAHRAKTSQKSAHK